MSTPQTKTWADAVVIKGEVKPSQQSGVLYVQDMGSSKKEW